MLSAFQDFLFLCSKFAIWAAVSVCWSLTYSCWALAQVQPRTLNFKETLQYALDNKRPLQVAAKEVTISELEVEKSTARFLPTLQASTSHGLQFSSPEVSDNPWTSQLSLELIENLYDNGENLFLLKLAKAKREEMKVRYEKERANLLRNVAQEYMNYSMKVHLRNIQKEQFDLIKKQYELAERDYLQGLKTRRDYLRLKTQMMRSLLDLRSSQLEVDKYQLQLQQLIGAEGEAALLVFVPEKAILPQRSLPQERLQLQNHWDMRLFQLRQQTLSLEQQREKRKLWPQVTLTSSVTYGNRDYLGTRALPFQQTDHLTWTTLLSFQYKIWDWGEQRNEVEIFVQKQKQERLGLENQLAEVEMQMQTVMMDISQAQEDFKQSEELLRLEESNLQFLQTDYRQGKVTYLDFLTGLKDFADARDKYITSLFELRKHFITYSYFQGKIHEDLL